MATKRAPLERGRARRSRQLRLVKQEPDAALPISVAPPSSAAPHGSSRPRALLVLLDGLSIAVVWFLLVTGRAPQSPLLARIGLALILGFLSLSLVAGQGLYQPRAHSLPILELTPLARTAGIGALAALALSNAGGVSTMGAIHLSGLEALAGATFGFISLVASRSVYRLWLNTPGAQKLFSRPAVVVGSNEEAFDLYLLLRDQPELGLHVCGVVGSAAEVAERGFEVPHLGEVSECVAALRGVDAQEALIAASAMPPTQLNRIVRDLLDAGIQVRLSVALRGIDHRRLRHLPLGHEPLFSVERASLQVWERQLKRVLDLVLGTVSLVAALPILAIAAIAIKAHDGGPVLFRQVRVGRGGQPFTMYKLRTMVIDAEQKLAQVADRNQRHGPLFKLGRDPRVTPVGRLLRSTSLDELPQLFNVLRGEMSLVGPRPAFSHEVAQFDDELRARDRERPGITGLWQVEARDNPSFSAYRRLDLFYLENWSVLLDLSILVATAQAVLLRSLRAVARGERSGDLASGEEQATCVLD